MEYRLNGGHCNHYSIIGDDPPEDSYVLNILLLLNHLFKRLLDSMPYDGSHCKGEYNRHSIILSIE
jgi:hypothetical protein